MAVVQAPLPSQVVDAVKVLPSVLHNAGVHTWLLLTLWQAPLPSQVPSVPHWLVAVALVQKLCAFLPTLTGAHVPSSTPVSVFVQALHPLQVVWLWLQQTPSTQLPRAQSVSAVHALPKVRSVGASGIDAG